MTKAHTNTQRAPVGIGLRILSVVGIVFGIMTLFSAGNVLFGPQSARELAGAYVPFVVWFNFVAGSFYIAAGIGTWIGRHWAKNLAFLIAIATGIAGLLFSWQVFSDEAYEIRTVGAMILRTGFWSLFAYVTWYSWR